MKIISASEIEKYTYCPLSWWLSKEGIKGRGNELREGIEKHKELEKDVWAVKEEEERAFTSEFMIVILASSASILSLIGIGIYLSQMIQASIITMSIAAMWLVSAAFFLFIALKSTQLVRERKRIASIPTGTIEYIGGEESENIMSKKHGLIGKPDYVISTSEGYIPVEFKAGRIPRGPLFSHILQMVVYGALVEEKYGAVPYGMLIYGNNQYKIRITEPLKDVLLKKINDMRTALDTGIIHRDHTKTSKCRHCSRREYCNEKLI